MCQDGWVLETKFQMMQKLNFFFQSPPSYRTSLWSFAPWHGTGDNCWGLGIPAPPLWPLRVRGQKTSTRDSPERTLFILFPHLWHTGVPPNVEWVNESSRQHLLPCTRVCTCLAFDGPSLHRHSSVSDHTVSLVLVFVFYYFVVPGIRVFNNLQLNSV